MKKKSFILACMILVAGLLQVMISSQVHAQEQSFAKLDTNTDGFISIKEAVAYPSLLAAFGKIDSNGDGKINHQELNSSTLQINLKLN